MKLTIKILLVLGILSLSLTQLNAQDLEELSLEELMNFEIYSASKKKENIFEAPLSSSVITYDEIVRSGANSIPEALRLAPGVIVRESTNGTYDVHVRGFDNTPPNAGIDDAQNLFSLVMIDGRIVFNYLNGGIIWNTLPIDINDVSRIEIIRGPAAAMYGPNAMTGVINIITKTGDTDNPGVIARGNVSTGTFNTTIANSNIGYQSKKLYAMASFNYQRRDRFQNEYYILEQQDYVELPATVNSFVSGPISNLRERYKDTNLAMNKYGVNAFFGYQASDDFKIDFSAGFQDAEGQFIFNENGFTPLSYNLNSSNYIDLRTDFKGLRFSLNNINGDQEIFNPGRDPNIPYNTFSTGLEYDIVLGDLTIRPGIGYIKSVYEWAPEISETDMTISSASLRADYTKEKFRLIAAIRGDAYNYPSDNYFSWQLSGLYNLNEANLFRVVYSKSNAAPFITRMHLDIQQEIPFTAGFRFQGNTNLTLQSMEMIELGYRSKFKDNLYADIEVFHSVSQNYSEVLFNDVTFEGNPAIPYTNNQFENIDLATKQTGATFSLNFVPSDKIQIKAFVTFQQTKLENFNPDLSDLTVTVNKDHTGTPATYGGFFMNFTPVKKLNINVNGYFFGKYTLDRQDESLTFPFPIDLTFDDDVPAHFVLNTKVSYEFGSNINAFVNARNLASNQRQYGFMDTVDRLVLVGVSFNLNNR